jgi:ABC-type spermidine/putrescine transport system permease subunit I
MFVNNIKLDVQSTMSTANNQYLSGILTGQNLTNAELDSLRSLRQQIEDLLAWGFASAIAVVLMAVTLALLAIYNRFFGLDRLWG